MYFLDYSEMLKFRNKIIKIHCELSLHFLSSSSITHLPHPHLLCIISSYLFPPETRVPQGLLCLRRISGTSWSSSGTEHPSESSPKLHALEPPVITVTWEVLLDHVATLSHTKQEHSPSHRKKDTEGGNDSSVCTILCFPFYERLQKKSLFIHLIHLALFEGKTFKEVIDLF